MFMDSSRKLLVLLFASVCHGDLCSDSNIKFQSTFPARKEFSEDGINVHCYSNLEQCTENTLEEKYGSNMTVNDLDAPGAHSVNLAPFCDGYKPGINLTWGLRREWGAKSVKGFIVRIQVPYVHYRCVVVLLKGEVNSSNVHSRFSGSFLDLKHIEEYHVSIRSLPSHNGTHTMTKDTSTTDCDLPAGTDNWCPPLESFEADYDYANRTLFVSFKQAEFGNLNFEMFETTQFDLDARLGNTTSVAFYGFEPGNYSFTIKPIDPYDGDSSKCLCKNKFKTCSACKSCREYSVSASATAPGHDASTDVSASTTASASTVPETPWKAAIAKGGDNKDKMSVVPAVVWISTSVVAVAALVTVTYWCYRRRNRVSSDAEGGNKKNQDRYIIMIIERTRTNIAEKFKEHILEHCHHEINVMHAIGVNDLKRNIINLTRQLETSVCFTRERDTVKLHDKDVEVFGFVFANEDIPKFYADVRSTFQDAALKGNRLKFKTAAVYRGCCDGLPKDECYNWGKDNISLFKDIAEYFDKTPVQNSIQEKLIVNLPPKKSSVPNAKRHKESIRSNTSSNVLSDSSTYVHRQNHRQRYTSRDSARGSSISSSDVSFHPDVQQHIIYPAEHDNHCLTVSLNDFKCCKNEISNENEFIPPDESESESDTDDDSDSVSETDQLIGPEGTIGTVKSPKSFVKKLDPIQNSMMEFNKRNFFM